MGANPVGGAVASRTKFGNGARLRVREKDIGDGGRGEYETLEEAAGRSGRRSTKGSMRYIKSIRC